MIRNIYTQVQKKIHNKKFLHDFDKNRLKNPDITLLTNCCVGGMLYHDFGLSFLSPTINLNIPFDDFLKYCNNLPDYKDIKITECPPLVEEFQRLGGSDVTFPCGKCSDISIFFQHYKTFDEAKKKWEERSERINIDNIAVVFLSWGRVTQKQLEEFKKIPYKKVMFTECPDLADNKNVYLLKPPEGMHWFDMDPKRSKYCVRHYYDEFDWVKFLNS